MMKVGVAISSGLNLTSNNLPAGLDYLEVNGEHDMAVLRGVLASRPALLHDLSERFWLNYEDPFDGPTLEKTRAMIELARPPWFSTGIGASAEPQGHTTDFWRGAPPEALQTRRKCLENIVRNGRRLKAWLGNMPLLLENYNYHPTNAYEYICEPDTYSQLIEDIDCGALLDLAHAQISAFNMGWTDPRLYLQQLPLDRVVEIHINHPYNEGSKQLLDRHLAITEDDLPLLEWTLQRTPALEAVTLEADFPGETGLRGQIDLIRRVIG